MVAFAMSKNAEHGDSADVGSFRSPRPQTVPRDDKSVISGPPW